MHKTSSVEQLKLSASPSTSPTSSCILSTRKARIKQFIVVSLFIIGLIVCVISLICILLLPTFVTNQISKKLVLKNNSLLLERWSKPNVPMYFKVWLFDVQNAQQIIDNRGTKPILKEIGPFVFHLKRQKDIVSFAGDNLYYTERKIYHFSPELSCCAINTTVTIPNIPLVAVVDRALSYNLPLVGRFIPRLINRAIQSLREQLFVRRQVREILFDGYEVDLLKMVSRVGSLVGLPSTNQRFALLKGRNDTWRPEQDGVWAINTGARDRRQFGKVSSWNSYKQLPFWASPSCNTINGSDGTLFPPPIKKSEPLYIFNQELCRTVNLVYDRPSDIRAIQAYRFVLNPMNFAHTMQPTNAVNAFQRAQRQQTPPGGAPMFGQTINSRQPVTADMTPVRPSTSQQQQQPQSQQQQSNSNLRAASSDRLSTRQIPNQEQDASGGQRWKNQRQAPPLQVVRPPQQQQQQQAATPINNNNNQLPQPTRQQLNTHTLASAPTSNQGQEAERLIKVVQEAHLDRQAQSKINPFTCFCDRKSTNLNGANVCEFDGLIDLSKCTKQAQVIFGSMPHFYQSDPRLLRQVVGLEPNASKHTTYLDIEPNTGLVLGGKRRVQLNLIIKHNNQVDGFENINDMLVPLVWFEESAMIPEESAKKFKSLYTDRIKMVNIVLITLFLAALGLLAIDLRLIATHYSHCFQIKMTCAHAGPTSSSLEHLKLAKSSSLTSDFTSNSSSLKQGQPASLSALNGSTPGKRRARNLCHSAAALAANLKPSHLSHTRTSHQQQQRSSQTIDYYSDEDNHEVDTRGYNAMKRTISGDASDNGTGGGQLSLPLLPNKSFVESAQEQEQQQEQQQQQQQEISPRNNSIQLAIRYNDTLLPQTGEFDGHQAASSELHSSGKSIIEIDAGHNNRQQAEKSEVTTAKQQQQQQKVETGD